MALSTLTGLEKQIRPQVGWKGCELVGWGEGMQRPYLLPKAPSRKQAQPHWPTGSDCFPGDPSHSSIISRGPEALLLASL